METLGPEIAAEPDAPDEVAEEPLAVAFARGNADENGGA